MMHLKSGGTRSLTFPFEKGKNIISVIIVTFNAEKFVVNCFKSIAMQIYKNLEVIVFDGASRDRTVELLKENEQLITYWQSEPDDGIYDAMNKATQMATGDWLYFMGIDDVLLPGFSQMAGKLTEKNTIYVGDSLTNKNEFLDGKFTKYRLAKMNICHQSIFYPAKVFEKYKYQTEYKIYADYALNLNCWSDNSLKKKYYPITICLYNAYGFSSNSVDALFEKDKDFMIKQMKLSFFERVHYKYKKWKRSKIKKR